MQPEVRRYRVVRAVGRGGFGTVYQAELLGEGGFRKKVALKVLNDEVAEQPDFARRLRDEARMLGLIDHPAVVRVDGLSRLGGRWTVVMEFVEGVDLKRLLAGGGVPVGPALEILEEVCSALHAVYDAPRGADRPLYLLHRDIKPSNIQLTPQGSVKVLDFGVARADFEQRESETRSRFFGSAAYMAPERLDAIDSHAGDVYGVGAVLLELVTGEALGRTSANRERHEARLEPALGRLRGVVGAGPLPDLVAACLAFDPALRPPARAVARQLRELRAGWPGQPWLKDWAAEAVPPLLSSRPRLEHDLSGSILEERSSVVAEGRPAPLDAEDGTGSGTLAQPAPAATSGRTMQLLLLLLSAAAGLVVVLAGGAAALFFAQDDLLVEAAALPLPEPGPVTVEPAPAEASAVDALASEAPPKAEPAEAAAPAAAPEAAPTPPPAAPAPSPAPSPAPAPAPAPTPAPAAAPTEEPAPAAPPAPAPAATGQVLLASGNATVTLVGAPGRFPPGAVPAGRYTIEAAFGKSAPVQAGSVEVEAGGVVRLSCRAALKRCIPRR